MTKAKTKKIAGSVNYEAFKEEALKSEPTQMKVDLMDIEISEEGKLIIEGRKFKTADGVVEKQLMKQVLNINPTLQTQMGKGLGPKLMSKVVNLVKAGVTKNSKKNTLTVIGNMNTKEVTHIMPGNKDFMTNRHALDMFEKTMNVSPDLTLVNAIVNANGGFECSVQKNIEVALEDRNKKRIVGEEFNPGYTFRNEPMHGMTVNHYVNRLVCGNGMTQRKIKGEFTTLDILEEGAIRKFFESFLMMNSTNFIPGHFPEQVLKAMDSRISFQELLNARATMFRNSDLTDKDIQSFLPEFNSAVNKLASQGFDFTRCSETQLANYITSYNMWDVINRVTDFGSHDYGFNANFMEIQKDAGKLFGKDVYDTQNVLLAA